MAEYVSATRLHEIALKLLRNHVASVTGLRIDGRAGPFIIGNWRVAWINVLAEDYGSARDLADRLETAGDWIMVPDKHPLDGQVFGKMDAAVKRR